jgi:hypothetical protein
MHSLYADNISLIIQDKLEYVNRIKDTFNFFGRASGLCVDWSKTKAAYISSSPLPAHLEQQQWTWETQANASKLLGFPVADSISPPQLSRMVTERLEAGLEKSRKVHCLYMDEL